MRADFAAAHEGGVDQFLAHQPFENFPVLGKVLGLAADRRFPIDAKPFQVAKDAGLEVRRATGRVDILDAQQKPAAGFLRHFRVEQSRIGMAEMQLAIRARSEPENGCCHESDGFRVVPDIRRLLLCPAELNKGHHAAHLDA